MIVPLSSHAACQSAAPLERRPEFNMVCLCHCTQLYKEPLHLQILSAQATALDGAGMTPTVLQCTTVRQEGPLPREDTAISVHYRNIKFFGTLGFHCVFGPQM